MAISATIEYTDGYASEVKPNRLAYGPVIQFCGENLKAGDHLACLLPKGFIPEFLAAVVVSPSGVSGAKFKVGSNSDGTLDDDAYLGETSATAAAGTTTTKSMVGDSGRAAIAADDEFVTITASADLGPGSRIDVCVFGWYPHPIQNDLF